MHLQLANLGYIERPSSLCLDVMLHAWLKDGRVVLFAAGMLIMQVSCLACPTKSFQRFSTSCMLQCTIWQGTRAYTYHIVYDVMLASFSCLAAGRSPATCKAIAEAVSPRARALLRCSAWDPGHLSTLSAGKGCNGCDARSIQHALVRLRAAVEDPLIWTCPRPHSACSKNTMLQASTYT